LPEKEVLRIAERRQDRARVHRKRDEDHEAFERQRREFVQRQGERDNHEQRDVVGQQRRERGRQSDQQKGETAFRVDGANNTVRHPHQES